MYLGIFASFGHLGNLGPKSMAHIQFKMIFFDVDRTKRRKPDRETLGRRPKRHSMIDVEPYFGCDQKLGRNLIGSRTTVRGIHKYAWTFIDARILVGPIASGAAYIHSSQSKLLDLAEQFQRGNASS